MNVSWTAEQPGATAADTVAIGVFQGEAAPAGAPAQVGELLAGGEARASFKSLALTHADGKRWLVVGLGARDDLTPERARVAAAIARERTREMSTKVLCWQVPSAEPDVVAALVQGTMLADYSFDSHRSQAQEKPEAEARPKRLEGLILNGDGDLTRTVDEARIVGEAVNEARDLQNRPANDLTPTALAEHATRLGSEIEHLSVEVEGREGILKRSMGAFAAVAQGSEEEPALITLRYDGVGGTSDPSGPLLGFVGKAVTFD
ncbi:MAG TPA: M17 family peptidase N-terminal domain-containing protein, partial [Solirubrobacteraceae bacterium]|nr:M17 family peptidase N-terminal domain-containing protein [Solirubrobacteraceae bacterium]